MMSIKNILETIKAVIYLPIYISKFSKRSEDLLRIEHKLDFVSQQLEKLDIASVNKQFTESAHIQVLNNDINRNTDEQHKSDILSLISSVEQKLENQFLQFESLLSIYRSLPNLKFLPATRGWAGSPDFLAKIAELILKEKPSFVLEVSSGVSTIIIGMALRLNNHGKVISIDHEEAYAKITIGNIEYNDIEDVSKVIHCPLREYEIFEQNWRWYETDYLNFTEKIDLLIIDGPPGSTQFLARYPAIPLFSKYFSNRTLIVLDDANRNDEVIVFQKWVMFLEKNDFKVSVSEFKNFEKGMIILEVCRLP